MRRFIATLVFTRERVLIVIIDGNTIADKTAFESDVCVVGAGAAGITLALELAQRGREVILVESGGLAFTTQSHALLDIELRGKSTEQLVNGTRERFFGGTTNHWGGEIRTLDEFEFEPHSWVPHSGWPIKRADIESYYVSAARLLGLSEVDRPYDPAAVGVGDLPRLVNATQSDFAPQLWGRVPLDHLRLGQSRREEVARSESLRCILNTSIAEILPDKSGDRVASLEGRTFVNKVHFFTAKAFVLCTGAIENARLLLVSDRVVPGGLGNEEDLVGRFFMDHAANKAGPILITDPSVGRFQEEALAEKNLVGWATTPLAREEMKLQGFMAIQWPRAEALQSPLQYALGVRSLARPNVAQASSAPPRYLNVAVNWEQSPNPSSRVMLSHQRDKLGIRKPILHWDVTKADIASAHRSAELLSLAVARSGYGRMRRMNQSPEAPLTYGGGHQMGTTRMSNDPRQGVTDANGRVHSLENLYIGGGSLFPTGGWQNPTFTIMALALRLADYLTARHSGTVISE